MQHLAELISPLGPDLLFHSLEGNEGLSQVSEHTLKLLSPKADIDFKQLLGQHIGVQMRLPEPVAGQGGLRHFDGIVAKLRYTGMQGRYHAYEANVRPWLWFLSRTQDCRIFQDQNVLDILKTVFADHAIARFDISKLTGHYTPWHYCVQYRETDLAFVLRLLAQEGITFYFTHAKGEHTLVLADGIASHQAFAGYATIAFANQQRKAGLGGEAIQSFSLQEAVQPGKIVLSDYDFERPSVDLRQQRSEPRPHALASEEIFDYPGLYVKETDGEQFARSQMEAQLAATRIASGSTDARGLAAGCTFTLQGTPRPQENIEYLVTGTRMQLVQAGYEGMAASAGTDSTDGNNAGSTDDTDDSGSRYNCSFTAIDARTQFRPARSAAAKPGVQGPQSAVVVGPAGSEIHTDPYGRVKVHFHWDRYGQRNGSDTCWLRVSLPWAGANWGAQFLPRIGQEVIVDFMEGDPDQPIITGRVYNAEQRPSRFSNAGSLPGNQALAGFKSKELAGGGYNQWLFDDTTGQLRTQVASTEAASQLNLGYLVHPRADSAGAAGQPSTPSAQPRGQGFELRTDAWGAIRAAKGLLITTDGKVGAVGGILDRQELAALLQEAMTMARQLTDNATTHQATTKQDEKTDGGVEREPREQQTKEIKGLGSGANNESQSAEPTANHLTLHSPAGIAAATPKNLTLASGEHTDIVAQKNLQTASGLQTHLHATTGLRQFTHSGGIHIIANEGKVLVQSQHDDTVVNAEKSIHMTASQQHILLEAKQHITFVESGGAYIKLSGGNIELGMPGAFTVKAASFKFTGPGEMNPSLPMFARSSCKSCILDAARQGAPGALLK
jgi:type VI secretion system secreted protein VgrG